MLMGIVIKKIKDLTLAEWSTLNMFYMATCELPESMPFENYNGDQIMCAKIEGRNLEKGTVIGALLFQEVEQTPKEWERYGTAKVISISRVDVRKEKRGHKIGTGLLKLALDYIDVKYKKPCLIKTGRDILGKVPEKFGFLEKNHYYYKYAI